MVAENKNWIAHEPSTYSYLGRNDGCVNWMLINREQKGLPSPKKIALIGSGIIEPFTIAALPLALQSQIIAVEIDPKLVELARIIKNGDGIPWSDIAKKTQHPGVVNTQLTNPDRLTMGRNKLASLGSLRNLGPNFTNDVFQVESSVGDRVTYIPIDALSALKSLSNIDMICDFFVQVNINKDQEKGIDYTRQMVKAALAALSPEGNYIIGDSGRNIPITLSHISERTNAVLNVSALVHAVNQMDKYSSSYYSVLGRKKMKPTIIRQTMKKNIDDIVNKFGLPLTEQTITIDQLAELSASHVYFGFLGNEDDNSGTVWYCPLPQKDTLAKLAPSKDIAFTDQIVFPK